MKQFITHLAKLLLFIILSHSFIVFITLALSKNINTTSHILAKDILNEGDKIYIMGNSHSECAINDSLLPDNYINISLSAEPLFYSVIKARRLLTENKKIDTIIIEFTNNSINTVGWVINNDRLLANYHNYFAKMDFTEHYFLYSNNLKKSLKAFFSLTPLKIWLSSKTVDGGYRYLVRDEVVSTKNIQKKPEKMGLNSLEHNRTLEYMGFDKLILLIKQNPNTHFILTRMPMHSSYIGFKNETDYQQCLEQIRRFQNCNYIDFTHIKLEDYCFGDPGHLNHHGATVFTPIFLDAIRHCSAITNQSHGGSN
jgi:hypothetical protein